MMDEVWSRSWLEAHKAALQVREEMARSGRPVPTLWDDLRRLVRDLITPPVKAECSDACCDAQACQSAA